MSWFGFHTHYATWELRIMRLLFAVVVFTSLGIPPVAAAPHPHGIARLVDLTFLADPETYAVLRGLLLLPLALFVWGRWMAASLTYVLGLWTGVWSLIQSQGAISHGSQIVGLVLLALWLAYTVGPWLRRRGPSWRPGLTLHDLAIYWVQQMIAAAYVVAGISKLTRSGLHFAPVMPQWVLDVQYAGVQITKTHDEAYFGTLDPAMLERAELLGGFFAANPDLTRVLFTGGLVLELFAFLLLISRRWAAGMGASLIAMHWAIAWTMNLRFTLNTWVALIFLVNVPFLVSAVVRTARSRRRDAVGPLPAT